MVTDFNGHCTSSDVIQFPTFNILMISMYASSLIIIVYTPYTFERQVIAVLQLAMCIELHVTSYVVLVNTEKKLLAINLVLPLGF